MSNSQAMDEMAAAERSDSGQFPLPELVHSLSVNTRIPKYTNPPSIRAACMHVRMVARQIGWLDAIE